MGQQHCQLMAPFSAECFVSDGAAFTADSELWLLIKEAMGVRTLARMKTCLLTCLPRYTAAQLLSLCRTPHVVTLVLDIGIIAAHKHARSLVSGPLSQMMYFLS